MKTIREKVARAVIIAFTIPISLMWEHVVVTRMGLEIKELGCQHRD